MLDKLCFVIPNEETRHYINGMFLHREKRGKKEYMRAVATDGHRLSVVEVSLPDGMEALPLFNLIELGKNASKAQQRRAKKREEETQHTIIPRKAAIEMQRLLGEGHDCTVDAYFGEVFCRFQWNTDKRQITIQSKYIDGTYPNYKRVLPKHKHSFKVSQTELSNVMDSLSGTKSTRLKFQIEKKKLGVYLYFGDISLSEGVVNSELEILPDKSMASLAPVEIGLNKYYVEEVVKSCSSSLPIKISFTDAGSPVAFEKGNYFYYLLMPMRT